MLGTRSLIRTVAPIVRTTVPSRSTQFEVVAPPKNKITKVEFAFMSFLFIAGNLAYPLYVIEHITRQSRREGGPRHRSHEIAIE